MNADKTNIMVFRKNKANEICVKLSDTAIKKFSTVDTWGYLLTTHLLGHTISILSTVSY